MNRKTGCWVAAPELVIFKEILQFLYARLRVVLWYTVDRLSVRPSSTCRTLTQKSFNQYA